MVVQKSHIKLDFKEFIYTFVDQNCFIIHHNKHKFLFRIILKFLNDWAKKNVFHLFRSHRLKVSYESLLE